MDRTPFLEMLPTGEKVGKLPSSIEADKLRLLGCPETPISAIRANCIDCCGGNKGEVRKCTAVGCSLWSMRMGKNPFYGKNKAVAKIIKGGPQNP